MTSSLRGRLDEAKRDLVRGWAQDPLRPEQPVSLLVLVDDALTGRVFADRFRQDLADAGLGSGRHAFELPLSPFLSPHVPHLLRVISERDGAELDGSPLLIEPPAHLDRPALERLGDLFCEVGADGLALLDDRIEVLLDRLDRLRAAHGGISVSLGSGLPYALVIDERMPDGSRDAGSCAVISHMKSLRRLGYEVLFVAADMTASVADRQLATQLAEIGITVCFPPYYTGVEDSLRRHGQALSLIYLHRGTIASRYAHLVRHHCPRARLLFATADLQYLRLARQAQLDGRSERMTQARQTQAIELAAVRLADAVLTHSTYEAELLRQVVPASRVHVAPWHVPVQPTMTSVVNRLGIAFLADYSHAPNLDAARRLLHEIMPLVWEHLPGMPCLLAGSHLPGDLSGDDPRVLALGHVPHLTQLFGRIRLSVAPLAFGAGIKGKVLESLSAGIPCVMSPIAAEGLDFPPEILTCVAEDTHQFARLIIHIHQDVAFNQMTGEAGLAWARSALSAERLDALLAAAIAIPAAAGA